MAFLLAEVLEHRLQALLELAAILGAGDERAHVERQQPLRLFSPSGTSPLMMRCAISRSRFLPTPGSADEHRVVLGAALQNLDAAPGFSSSRPMTGPSLPCSARSVRSMVYFSSALARFLDVGVLHLLRCAGIHGLVDAVLRHARIPSGMRPSSPLSGCREHEQLA